MKSKKQPAIRQTITMKRFCFCVNFGANKYAQKKPKNGFICIKRSLMIACAVFELIANE